MALGGTHLLCIALKSTMRPPGILLIRVKAQHYLPLLCVSENYLETVPPVDDC